METPIILLECKEFLMLRLRRFAGRTVAAGLLILGGLAVTAGVASATTAGSCSAQGQYAICDATATINNPTTISVTVTASPNQTVFVAWDDTCSQGLGAGGDSGSFTATTPVTRTIQHPYAHPDMCIVSADAQLQNGGNSIHLAISSPAVVPPRITGYAGKCVADPGNKSANGTKVVLWSCDGESDQWWAFKKGELIHNGKCVTDVNDGGSGSPVVLDGCSSAKDDAWTHKSNGEYVLAAHSGKLCLTDPSSATRNGTGLDVSACKDTKNQRWTLP
jgi:Ricin-type beta-trefoil lectin domain